jgi:HTH-type transcriptional regulator/antitoxin HipB
LALDFPIGNMIHSIGNSTDLGAALRAIRKARQLRQEDLALAAGVGLRFIGELERGKSTVRLAETLRVASALGVRILVEDPHAQQ